MLIALPNQDRSFTLTLFMPKEMFDELTSDYKVVEFFEKYFIDALNLIGREETVKSFFANKPSPLISIKCSPHHGKKCVLLGDSVHSMVPFYGQGMNAAFEDCVVFFEMLDKFGFDNLDKLLNQYSEQRVPDAHAICDLAVHNYTEMRYLVTTKKYKLRKLLDGFLNKLFPKSWIPLYTMVTFTRIRYSECIKKREEQDKLLQKIGNVGSLLTLGLMGFVAYKFIQRA